MYSPPAAAFTTLNLDFNLFCYGVFTWPTRWHFNLFVTFTFRKLHSNWRPAILRVCVCVCVSGQRVQFGKCWSEAVKCITRWSFSGEGKRDEWLLLERGSFRGKVIFSWGGDEGEGKLRLLEPRLIKITSASRDKVNHPLCSSAENTHGPETWAVVAAGWPRRESSHPLRRSEVVTCR